MNKLIIIGAGGHGRVIADAARLCGYVVFFLDDNSSAPNVIGKSSEYLNYIDECEFTVGIGNSKVRERLLKAIRESGGKIATIVHPSAVIASDVSIGEGSVVMAGSVINTGASVGIGAIINTSSSVDHDCAVGDYCHVSVGAHLAGTVVVGDHTMIGAGATVINNISICEDCMIGAGAVVVRDIEERGVFVGVPAKRIK